MPLKVNVPAPLLVNPPAPLITPAMLTLWLLVSIRPVLVSVTVRVLGEVIVPAACKVPPVKISVFVALPSPNAAVAFAFRIPAPIVVAPVYVFIPESVCVPLPLLVRPPVPPLITPEKLAVAWLLPPTVRVFAPSVTLPAPVRPSIVSLAATL